MVTILRIVAVKQLKLTDLSYSAVNDGIWSELEPCLGIVNACLPVLQPALAEILTFNVLTWTTKSTRGSSARSTRSGIAGRKRALAHEDSRDSHFIRQHEDVYPLNGDLPMSGLHGSISTATPDRPLPSKEDLEAQEKHGNNHDLNLTSEWLL